MMALCFVIVMILQIFRHEINSCAGNYEADLSLCATRDTRHRVSRSSAKVSATSEGYIAKLYDKEPSQYAHIAQLMTHSNNIRVLNHERQRHEDYRVINTYFPYRG